MRCSTIIGTVILPETQKIYKTVNDEKFLEIEVGLGEERYPAVVSEFLLKEAGRSEIMFYLRSEGRDNKLFTFINIVSLNKVAEETPELNTVAIYGNVSKTMPMKVLKRRGESVKLVGVRYFSSDKNVNVAHCIGFKDIARRLNTFEVDDNVLLLGKLKMAGNIEVVVEKISMHNPKLTPQNA